MIFPPFSPLTLTDFMSPQLPTTNFRPRGSLYPTNLKEAVGISRLRVDALGMGNGAVSFGCPSEACGQPRTNSVLSIPPHPSGIFLFFSLLQSPYGGCQWSFRPRPQGMRRLVSRRSAPDLRREQSPRSLRYFPQDGARVASLRRGVCSPVRFGQGQWLETRHLPANP